MSDTSIVKSFLSGASGGVCVVLTGHPLDTIKVRLQHQNTQNPVYSGFFDCVKKILRNEGPRGFYKGMAAPLAGVSPMIALSFGGYNIGKKMQTKKGPELSLFQIFNAGCISGVFTTAIVVPGDRIKCLLQIQQNSAHKLYSGPIDCIKKIVKTEGLPGLYKGSVLTFLRDSPGSGIYFLLYEFILRNWMLPGQTRDDMPLYKIMFAGGLSGSAFWLFSIMPDTLKTKLQTAPHGTYKNLFHLFTNTIKDGGVTSLFRGLTPVMIRSFPANAACFFGYETCRLFLDRNFPNI